MGSEMCIRDSFINEHYPEILTVSPEDCKEFVKTNSEHGGAAVSYTHLTLPTILLV